MKKSIIAGICLLILISGCIREIDERNIESISVQDLELDCMKKNQFLTYTNIDEYNCSQIKKMILSDDYVPVIEHYNSTNCDGENVYWILWSNETNCKDCNRHKWLKKYNDSCLIKW